MPRATIAKIFRFEAAHQLPNHDGKCRNLHGHSYKVEVLAAGDLIEDAGSPKEGMVVDFSDVSRVFKERIHRVCDHQFLNDVLPVPVTTAEWIAHWILGELKQEIPAVTAVVVWETETSSAIAEAE